MSAEESSVSSDLSLTVLGCCGSYAGPGGACSGYLVRGGGEAVWLDAGPGTLAKLQEHVTLGELSALVLTHEHPDHWLELPVLRNALQYYEQRSGFSVVSNVAVRRRAVELVGADELDAVFDWTIVDPSVTHRIGGQVWTFSETEHYVPTLAMRVEVAGRSLGFSADTGPGWSMTELAPVNLALIEATYARREGHEGVLHLTAGEAAQMATDVAADHLVLTHQAPSEDGDEHLAEARNHFAGEISIAAPGAVYAA